MTTGKFLNGRERLMSKNRMPSISPVSELKLTLQRHRPKSADKGAETKVAIEIRVEPGADMETPGSYEKLRAKELAQGVSLFYPPGAMDEEAHRVFASVAREVEDVIVQNRNAEMEGLLNRWRDAVLAACKRMLESTSPGSTG